MTLQSLFYKNAVPVARDRHAGAAVEALPDFRFSAGVNSVPLMAVEFGPAAREYPIVFAGPPGDLIPAAILGLGDNQNLFLTDGGAWDAGYIPAFVRRYPFVFSQQGDQLVLCLDEESAAFNQAGRGQPLFTPGGEPSAYVNEVMAFLKDYQLQFARTRAFCDAVEALDLLEPMQANFTAAGGSSSTLSGFSTISRERLRGLPDAALLELARSDMLELIHVHLHSMGAFDLLARRLGTARPPGAALNG